MKTQTASHTPPPWKIEPGAKTASGRVFLIDAKNFKTIGAVGEHEAPFIIRAVNVHEELVEALALAHESETDHRDNDREGTMRGMCAMCDLISKAEGHGC